jgi:hypothetical protein
VTDIPQAAANNGHIPIMLVLPSVELYGGAMEQFDDLEFIQAMSQVIRRMCGCGDMKSSQAPIQDFTAGLRGGFAAVDHRRQFAAVWAGERQRIEQCEIVHVSKMEPQWRH